MVDRQATRPDTARCTRIAPGSRVRSVRGVPQLCAVPVQEAVIFAVAIAA